MGLTNEIIKGLLPEETSDLSEVKTTAIYAGGFKPPTAGHFAVVKQAIMQNPEIDEFIIYIGNKTRDGVDQNQSLLIWDIYKNYLSIKIVLEPTSKPPIQAVYNYAKDHPDEEVLWVIGAREGNEDDFSDIAKRTKSLDNYPNLELEVMVTASGASGTAARNASKISLEKLKPMLPKILSDDQYKEIFNILDPNLKENEPPLLKEILDPANFNFKPLIKSLTSSMEKDGLILKPYPKIIFKHDEEANAEDFFGKTAYYDPNNNEVVLYTLGRHPKDIMRSYAHELIHVHQNHEDRLEGINTDDVNEDDYLEKIEREAYEKGNISFRSWTNKILNEAVVGDKIECDNCDWSWDIVSGGDDLFVCHKCGHDNEPINENLDDSNLNNQLKNYIEDYSDIDVSLLKNLSKIKNKYPKQLDPKVGGNEFGYRGTTFDKDFIKKLKVKSKSNGVTEYEVPSDLKITSRGKKGFLSFSTDEEVAKGFGHYSGYVDHKKSDNRIGGYVKVSLDNPNFIIHPDYMGELSKDMEYSKESEKETLYVGDSFTPKSIFVVDKDLYKLKEDKKKDPFGLNAFAHELAQLNEEEGEYYIYLDMDGVVADFDKRFEELSGMLPQSYVDKNGLKAFWDLIDEKHKVAFWRGIELMPGAEQLVRYVEQHPFEMLTAPSIKKQSVIGKSLWVKDKVGTLYSSKPKVTYRSAKQKHTVKPNLTKFDILIDDKGSTIDSWNAAGGTAILYQNAGQVINDLKKLGL